MRLSLIFLTISVSVTAAATVEVKDTPSLTEALKRARPGDVVRVAPGNYAGGMFLEGLQGTEKQPIRITAADPAQPPHVQGGENGIHLSGCSYIEVSHLRFSGAKANGINVDDGRKPGSAQGIQLRDLSVTGPAAKGNRDGIKLSGLDRFTVERCRVVDWGSGGSGIDMVGCHDGRVRGCTFERTAAGEFEANGVQMKGGSARVTVERCRFVRAGGRGVNLGGSTGAPYMRPADTTAEASALKVQDCCFVDTLAPVAFVGVDGAEVSHNTIINPGKWVIRILQENNTPGFVRCRKGVFTDNVIVYQSASLGEAVNTGPNTEPATFVMDGNVWYAADRPEASRRQIRLPVSAPRDTHGTDPRVDAATGRCGNTEVKAGVRPETSSRPAPESRP